MPDFIFAYHGGKMPESEEEVQKSMAAWMAWFGGMADALSMAATLSANPARLRRQA